MPLEVDWRGVYPAVPSQFKKDLSLDIDATKSHIEMLLDNGIHGLVMLGTIGENTSLDLDEKIQVLRAAVEVAGGKVPVLTGAAEFTTQGACNTVAAAAEAGVDGIMLLFAIALLVLCWLWYEPLALIESGFDFDRFAQSTFKFIYSEPTNTIGIRKFWIWLAVPLMAVNMSIHALANLVEGPPEVSGPGADAQSGSLSV